MRAAAHQWRRAASAEPWARIRVSSLFLLVLGIWLLAPLASASTCETMTKDDCERSRTQAGKCVWSEVGFYCYTVFSPLPSGMTAITGAEEEPTPSRSPPLVSSSPPGPSAPPGRSSPPGLSSPLPRPQLQPRVDAAPEADPLPSIPAEDPSHAQSDALPSDQAPPSQPTAPPMPSVGDLSSPIQEPVGIDSLPRDSQLEVGTHSRDPEDASSEEVAKAPLTLSELAAQAERESPGESDFLENDGETESEDPSRKLLTFSADKPGWSQGSGSTTASSAWTVGVEAGLEPPRAAPSDECTDIQPGEDSCAQQKDWGKCAEPWLVESGFCLQTCGVCTPTLPPPPPAPTKIPPQQETQAMCEQASDPGTGSQSLIRWYHDPESQKCRQFNWTGRGGNSNCFVDFATCSSQAALRCGVPESAPFL